MSHSGGGGPESPTGQPPLLPAPWAAEDTAPHVPSGPGKQPSPVFVNPASGQAAVCNRPGPASGRGGGSLSVGRGQWCRRGQWCCRAREDRPIRKGGHPACTLWPKSHRPRPRPRPQAPGREVFLLEKCDLTPRRSATSRPGREKKAQAPRLLEGGTPSSLPASSRVDASRVDAPATPSSTLKPAVYLFQVRECGPAGTPALLPQAPGLSRWSPGPPPGASRHRSAGPPLRSALAPACTQGCPRGSQSTRGRAVPQAVPPDLNGLP